MQKPPFGVEIGLFYVTAYAITNNMATTCTCDYFLYETRFQYHSKSRVSSGESSKHAWISHKALWIRTLLELLIFQTIAGSTLSCHEAPLHKQAKSRDHEITRAQKKVPKGHLNTPSKSCSVKPHVTGPSTQMLFQRTSNHTGSSHMIKYNKPMVVSVQSAMIS